MMRVQISPTAPNWFGSLCAEVAVTGKHASLKNSCPHGRAGSNPVFRTKHFQPEWLELAYTAVLKAADFGHKGSNPFSGTRLSGMNAKWKAG